MIRVLRDATYRALFSAQVAALLGTGLLTVALGLLAFDLAGDAAGTVLGTALTIKMVAYVGLAPLIAALVDRLPPKVVLIGADAVRIAIALSLPAVSEVWQVYLLVFVLQSASATFTPTFQALIPAVLPDPGDYTRALALSRLAYDLEALLSPAIAVAVLLVAAPGDLFIGTAIGFAGSALLVLVARLPADGARSSNGTFWSRLTGGVRVFSRTPSLRFVLTVNVLVAAATAFVLVNSVVYARAVHGLDDAALAVALGCFGAGSIAAALAVTRLVERSGIIRTMLNGGIAVVVGLVVVVVVTGSGAGWPWLLAAWVVLGAGTSMAATPSARLLADASTPANRTLVFTAQFALSHACFLVTYPIAGWLGAWSLLAAAAVLAALAAAALAAAMMQARRVSRARPR